MRTVLFTYYLKRKSYSKAMFSKKEQGFDFVHSYKIEKCKNTVFNT